MKAKSEIRDIKKGHIVKRIVALLMDGALAIFSFFVLFLFVFSPIANKAFNYKDKINEASKLQIDSHLFIRLDEKDTRNMGLYELTNEEVISLKDKYENESETDLFKDGLKYYYLNFKTGNATEGAFFASDYNQEIILESGEKMLPSAYYTEEWFDTTFKDVTSVDDWVNASYDATADFYQYFRPYQQKIKRIELFMIAPSYVISFGVFLFMIPLLYKNGETLGKKTLHLGFVTKDGYSVQKRQIVTRQLFLFVLVTFATFFIGVGFTSFATLAFGVAIYFIGIAISKSGRSFADLLAYTYLIDTRASVWFDSPAKEEEKLKEVEARMKTYKKYKKEEKHLLQVGDKIVDEDAKKEFLAEQEKTSKKQK